MAKDRITLCVQNQRWLEDLDTIDEEDRHIIVKSLPEQWWWCYDLDFHPRITLVIWE
jgi:hypothetical protein